MKKFLRSIKDHIRQQPVSATIILLIWIVCLVPIPDTPLNRLKFIDKWTHFTMYGVLVLVIMIEYGLRKKEIVWRRLLGFGLLAAIVMSGLIELAQAYLTHGIRTGDWLDFAANAVGAVIGCLIGMVPVRLLATRRKDGTS